MEATITVSDFDDAMRREWEILIYGRPLAWQPASRLTVRNWPRRRQQKASKP